MDLAAILLNGAEPSTDGLMWNLSWFWKRFFKCFYYIWAWWLSWSTDRNHLYKFSIPLQQKSPHEVWSKLGMSYSGEVVQRCGRTTDGRQNKKNNVYPCKPQFYCIKLHTFEKNAGPDETAHNPISRLIRTCTIFHSVIEWWTEILFASMDVSKFRDGWVHFINSEVKGLTGQAE